MSISATDVGGLRFVEASAGTGKTHRLAGTVVDLVAVDAVPIEQIAVVTFTRAAAGELRERVRERLTDARFVVAEPTSPLDDVPERLAARLAAADAAEPEPIARRLDTAVADIDRATVTTIHGFCQQVLSTLPLPSPDATHRVVTDDLADIIRSAAIDLFVARVVPGERHWPPEITESLSVKNITDGVQAIFNNPMMELRPSPDDEGASEVHRHTVALIQAAAAEVEERLERRGLMGHHHLLERTHRAVTTRPEVVGELRERFTVALIDEFQDTDPLQWSIFSTIFLDGSDSHGIVAVGDPKQAIYSFRGGDVGTYLDARRHPDVRHTEPLNTNYRSGGAMVGAFNALFRDVGFGGLDAPGGERIEHADIMAAADNADARLCLDDRELPPVAVRVAAHHDLRPPGGQWVPADAAARSINADVADYARWLVDSPARIVNGEESSELGWSNLAVLCRSRRDCHDVHVQLTRRGVPAVIAGSWSVTDTDAVDALRDVLWCLSAPGSTGRLRRLAVGPLVRMPPEELLADGSPSVAALHDQVTEAIAVLADHGVSAMYRFLRTARDLPRTVLSEPGGDRLLVDLEHLIELLAAETGDRGTSPLDLFATLTDLVVRGGGDTDPGDLYRRRTPSDGSAVQVMTIHASKGLEFDVVLCPTLARGAGVNAPYRHSELDPEGRRVKVYDVRGKQGKKAVQVPAQTAAAATTEARDEALRVGYVAITRARHHCALWYPGTRDAEGSALGMFLGLTGREVEPFDDAILSALNERWSGLTGPGATGLIDASAIGASAAAPTPLPASTTATADELAVAAFDRVLPRHDSRWSFSRLTHQASPVATDEDDPDDDTLGDTGRRDEGPVLAPLLDDVGMGTAFGTLVHETLERVDLSSSDLPGDLSAALLSVGGPATTDPDHGRIVAGLEQSILTPLGPTFDGLRLADFGPADHLDEADFEFSLPSASHAVAASRLVEVISDHLRTDDPLRPWAARLAAATGRIELGGFMVGSIDGLFRVTAPGSAPRFVVVDYKTNWLGRRGEPLSLDDYAPDRLVAAMAHHNYPLQALIYAVATHRFLRWRMSDYDPAVHLGGAAYLFLRGMVGPATPCAGDDPYGVFSWRLPTAMVLDASDVLSDLDTARSS